MAYLFFVGYLILFSWLVTKTRFFKASGLSKPQLVIIFLLKVIAGIFYGWIGLYYGGLAKMSDTWFYHHFSFLEYQLLGTDPKEYFINLFHNPYEQGIQNVFGSSESYWNDLEANFFIKVLSIFNIFSFGHYYINVIFYSFLSLFGSMAIYRVMTDIFPGRKIPVLIATFFIPSFLYWTSGIHKEGFIFIGIGLIVYNVYFGNKEKKLGLKRIIGVVFGMFLLVILRNFLIAIIVPALIAWFIANRFPKKALTCFIVVYAIFIVLFFSLRYIHPGLDFPQAVANKQQAFMQLHGKSSIPISRLEPNALSFLENMPQAFTLSSVRPYPTDIRHLLSLAASLEINVLLLLIIVSLVWRRKGELRSKTTALFCLFFAISLLLAIGFTVNNLGAIVRYRSIVIPIVMVIVIAQTNWEKIGQLVFKNPKREIV